MNSFYLFTRVLHILTGAIWVGVAVFGALFLTPAAADMGPDGMKLAQALKKRGAPVFMPIMAGVTILSGIWLYWRFTAGFSPEVSRSHSGMAYGTGGILGLLAFLVGALGLSRAILRAASLATEAAKMPEGREKAARLAQAVALRERAAMLGKVVALLVVITVILMATAPHL